MNRVGRVTCAGSAGYPLERVDRDRADEPPRALNRVRLWPFRAGTRAIPDFAGLHESYDRSVRQLLGGERSVSTTIETVTLQAEDELLAGSPTKPGLLGVAL